VRTISGASGEHLAPPELLARLRAADPSRRVATLAVWSDPSRAARVTYAAEESPSREAGAGPPPWGEVRYVDPRTGGVAAARGDRGEAFFRTLRSLHRWLIADRLGDRDVGRQIVGAATIVLVFLTLSGLYLRWPRGRTRNWRAWLTFNPRFKGRTFLWHLHAISGTWVLIAYLVMSLTGLQWSYEWYRNG
jgi:sulfite reductase (NADPH) flavoprotein alpha-component